MAPANYRLVRASNLSARFLDAYTLVVQIGLVVSCDSDAFLAPEENRARVAHIGGDQLRDAPRLRAGDVESSGYPSPRVQREQ